MIVAAAFCPSPPLLHPEVLGPAGRDMGGPLRSACAQALRRVLALEPEAVTVVGPADCTARVASEPMVPTTATCSDAAYGRGDAADLSGYGVPVRLGFDGPAAVGAARLPLSLALGAWLLDEAGFAGPRLGLLAGRSSQPLPLAGADDRRWVLLVMGDGSARRTEKSPGWYDKDAVGFDDTVTEAMASGDGAALFALDVGTGDRVLAAGVGAWREAGAVLRATPMTAQLHYAEAPFGVFYVVSSWLRT